MFLSKNLQLMHRNVQHSNSLIKSISARTCQLCIKSFAAENHTASSEGQEPYLKELMSSLDCPRPTAKHILTVHPEIGQMELEALNENIVTLKFLGYKKTSVYGFPKVLSLDPVTLLNRALIVDETQLKRSVSLLYDVKELMKLRVSVLKAYGLINDKVDVEGSLLSRLPDYPVQKSLSLDERQNLVEFYVDIMKAYVIWKLSIKNDVDARMIKKSHFRELSITQLKSNIFFLLNVAAFSKEMILNNFKYVRRINPGNLSALMDVFKSKGSDIRKLWQTRPLMLTLKYSQVLQTLKLLEEFDVPFEAALNCPTVFRLPPTKLRRNLQFIFSVKELKVYRFHSRFLELVVKLDHGINQLQQLQKLGFNKISLSNLIDKCNRARENYTPSSTGQMDLLTFVSMELNQSREAIKARLSRHPFWSTISLLQIEETLKFLLNNHFRPEEIFESLQLILYPRVRVELEMLLLNKRDFTECRDGLSFGKEKAPVKREFVLPLVLYFIEKGTKFSGDGVWLDNMFSTLNDTDYEDDVEEVHHPGYYKNQNSAITSSDRTSPLAQSFS